MSRIALYREWRPRTFDQVVEQRHTVAALRQSVVSGNISHAYLFSGTRGTARPHWPRFFHGRSNCLRPRTATPVTNARSAKASWTDPCWMSSKWTPLPTTASTNIRRICDEVQFLPTLARYKVYIVDEVHMLSPGAFNALLKTLEEPPAHAVFILATTDPHRIPPTIVSRCQRYDFHRIPVAGIVGRLREISDANGIRVTDDALEAVATLSDGALRDAISLLDQCRATFTAEITRDDVLSLAGVVNDTFMYDMGCAMADRDAARAMELTDAMILDGRDVVRFTSDLAAYYRDIMMCQVSTRPDALVRASSEAIRGMRILASRYRLDTLLAIVRDLSELLSDLRWAPDPRTLFEITLIRIMQTARTDNDGTPPPETRGTAAPARSIPASPLQPPAVKATLPTRLNCKSTSPQRRPFRRRPRRRRGKIPHLLRQKISRAFGTKNRSNPLKTFRIHCRRTPPTSRSCRKFRRLLPCSNRNPPHLLPSRLSWPTCLHNRPTTRWHNGDGRLSGDVLHSLEEMLPTLCIPARWCYTCTCARLGSF